MSESKKRIVRVEYDASLKLDHELTPFQLAEALVSIGETFKQQAITPERWFTTDLGMGIQELTLRGSSRFFVGVPEEKVTDDA